MQNNKHEILLYFYTNDIYKNDKVKCSSIFLVVQHSFINISCKTGEILFVCVVLFYMFLSVSEFIIVSNMP